MKPEHILLINPNRIQPPIAPLGLEYLAAALVDRGFAVELLDLAWEDDPLAAVKERLRQRRYGAVGISVRNTDDCSYSTQDFFLPQVKELVATVKSLTKSPVMLGGCGFSVMPEAVLSYCGADYGLAGDGEAAMAELLGALGQGRELAGIRGLVYRHGQKIIVNPLATADLARLPCLARRDLVDNRRYFAEGGQAGLETKRGCDRKCIYCADPLAKGRKPRLRPPAHIIQEITNLLARGIDCFHLCDAEFNIPEEHAREVCREIIRAGLGEKIKWYTYASPKPFSLELALLMRRAGCIGINFGVDSGHPGVLKALGRDFGPEEIVAAVRASNQAGLACMLDLLIGGPQETPETVAETVRLVKGLEVTAVGVALGVRIYRGTGLAALVEEEGFHPGNPNLKGRIEGNENCLEPVFYLSSALGPEPEALVSGLIGSDARFLLMAPAAVDQSYNYNQNLRLVEAIRRGYRGAYWHILRQIG
jgi:radical SAM superfamily enzyme YgiQ (UPF0313 family)